MQRNICQICGKDMSESGEVLYSRIYDTPGINEDKYIQRIGCCDNCGFVTVLNPLGDTEMDKHYSFRICFILIRAMPVTSNAASVLCLQEKSNPIKNRLCHLNYKKRL